MANLRPNLDTAILTILDVTAVQAVATGGIYNSIAHPKAVPPFIIYQAVSKTDHRTLGVRFGDAVYLVKGISRSNWPSQAAELDTQIDLVMEDTSLTIMGYNHVTGMCFRTEDFYFQEESGGVMWTHQGGLYRIEAGEA